MFKVLLALLLTAAAVYGADLWSAGRFPLQMDILRFYYDTPSLVALSGLAGMTVLLWSALKTS